MGFFRRVFSMMCIRAVDMQFVQRFLQAKQLDDFFFTILNVSFLPQDSEIPELSHPGLQRPGMTGSWSSITSLVLTRRAARSWDG